jgi:hypothetical protein
VRRGGLQSNPGWRQRFRGWCVDRCFAKFVSDFEDIVKALSKNAREFQNQRWLLKQNTRYNCITLLDRIPFRSIRMPGLARIFLDDFLGRWHSPAVTLLKLGNYWGVVAAGIPTPPIFMAPTDFRVSAILIIRSSWGTGNCRGRTKEQHRQDHDTSMATYGGCWKSIGDIYEAHVKVRNMKG